MTIASSSALIISYKSQLADGTYTILVAFVAMGIAFMIFWFAWKLLHRVVK